MFLNTIQQVNVVNMSPPIILTDEGFLLNILMYHFAQYKHNLMCKKILS